MIKPIHDADGITVYCADCRDVLPQLGRSDLLLTDPNYGVESHLPNTTFGRDENSSRGNLAEATDWGYLEWDKEPPAGELLAACLGSVDSKIIFGGNYFDLPPAPCWLVWDKDNGTNDYADCELAWTNLKKAVRMFRYRWNGMLQQHSGTKKESRVHPTQKPLALMQWCLSLVPDAKTVLDPFGGSLTTAVACKLAGIECTIIEQDSEYCRKGIERLRQGVLAFPE